jgi:hypothetical protein
VIKKTSRGYKVVSEKTGKNLGRPYKTRAAPAKRLRQVEFFKRSRGSPPGWYLSCNFLETPARRARS